MPQTLASGQVYNFDPFASGTILGNAVGNPFGNVISQNPKLMHEVAGPNTPAIGSGSVFTGGAGGESGGPNPSGGQLGSAGTGTAKGIADVT